MPIRRRMSHALAAVAFFVCTARAGRACAAYDPETDGWVLGIGDASIFGWTAVGLYLLGAVVLHRSGTPEDRFRRPASWVMAFLCLNKALDLQTAPAEWAKRVALDGGWYGGRLSVQLLFIALGVGFALWSLRALPRRLGARWEANRASALALVALISFILIRASSLHQLWFLGSEFGGLRVGTAVEIVLVLVVIGGTRARSLPLGTTV